MRLITRYSKLCMYVCFVAEVVTDGMLSLKLLNIISALSLIHMFFKVVTSCTQQWEEEYSVTGKMLKGFTFKKMKVKSPSECLQVCKDNESCHSFNYVMLEDICELNNRIREITPEELEDDSRRYFFQVKRLPPPPSGKFTLHIKKNT